MQKRNSSKFYCEKRIFFNYLKSEEYWLINFKILINQYQSTSYHTYYFNNILIILFQ